jgi:hypothetical protein
VTLQEIFLKGAKARPATGSRRLLGCRAGPMTSEHMRLRLTIRLGPTEIEALTRRGFLPPEQHHNPNAVRGALIDLLLRALAEPCDA